MDPLREGHVVGALDLLEHRLRQARGQQQQGLELVVFVVADLGSTKGTLVNGERIEADRAVVTLPIGLLRDGRFRLDPLPPPNQQAAISRLGYGAGVLAKVYLRFPHQFWPDKSKWFGRLPDSPERRGTFNTFVSHVEETGLPILLSFANGHSAVRYEREMGDEDVKQAALDSLRKMFGHNKVPEPEAFVFPRWLTDPWSMGGYSYPAIGSPSQQQYMGDGQWARPSPDPGEGVPHPAPGEAARPLHLRRHGEAVRPVLQGGGPPPR